MKLKKYSLLSLLLVLLWGNSSDIKAQSQYGWTYRTECLTMIASYSGKTDSCLTVSWQSAGTTFTGSSFTFKFPTRGTYQVCMKVINKCRKWDTIICKTVTVDTCVNPCNNFKPDFTWKAECKTARFIASSGMSSNTGVSYSWSWGDGSSGTGTDPTKQFVKDGTYKVCLKATWQIPGTTTKCIKEICKEIKISCTDPCNIKGELKIIYGTGGQIRFEASSNTGYFYTWNFGDGTTGTGKSVSKWYKKPGTYNVCVRICDKTQKCCTTICKKIEIEEPCRLQGGFSFKSTGNGSFKFTGYSSDKGATYSWNFGDGTTGTGIDPQKTYLKAGTYNVCVTITSSDKRCKITICRKVVIESKRCIWNQAGFTITSTSTCAVVKLEAYNLLDTCISYQWTVNGTLVDNIGGRLKTITLPRNGTYTICLKLTNNCRKCDTVICKSVTVSCYKPPCNWAKRGAGFTFNVKCPNLILEGNNLNTSTNGCVKYAYTISKLNGVPLATFNGRVQTIGFNTNGDYNVCLKLTDTCLKCDTIICKKVTVNCAPCSAVAKFRVDSVSKTGIVYVTNQSTGAYSYTWNWGDSTSSTLRSPIYHVYKYSGTRNICLTVFDSLKKCSTTFCITVQVVKSRTSQQYQANYAYNAGMIIYPNPADQTTTVAWTGSYSKLSIHSISGKQVYQATISGNQATLQASSLPPGVYTLQLLGTNGKQTGKLIVERNP